MGGGVFFIPWVEISIHIIMVTVFCLSRLRLDH